MTKDTHALTLAQAQKQIREYDARRRAICDELASLYATRLAAKGAGPAPISDQEKKARERARTMLNGSTPSWLDAPPSAERENELVIERDALDLVLRALNDHRVIAEAAEELSWTEAHRKEWAALCKEIILTRLHLEALERKAEKFVEQHRSAPLPLRQFIGDGPFTDPVYPSLKRPLDEAIREGVITQGDLKKASNV
jgi:hypothetical protein